LPLTAARFLSDPSTSIPAWCCTTLKVAISITVLALPKNVVAVCCNGHHVCCRTPAVCLLEDGRSGPNGEGAERNVNKMGVLVKIDSFERGIQSDDV
jgi:hypothetical protein